MNLVMKNRLEMMIAVRLFSAESELPANARATVLFALLLNVENEMMTAALAQVGGRGRFLGANTDRLRTASALRLLLRQIARIAKVLDPAEFPDVAQQFRGPVSNSYQALVASANAIKKGITPAPIKAAFVARGLLENFDVELGNLIHALNEATARKFAGRGGQVGGTAGLLAASRRGLEYVRELNAIMQVILADKPALLAKWKSASHIQRAPVRSSRKEREANEPNPPLSTVGERAPQPPATSPATTQSPPDGNIDRLDRSAAFESAIASHAPAHVMSDGAVEAYSLIESTGGLSGLSTKRFAFDTTRFSENLNGSSRVTQNGIRLPLDNLRAHLRRP